jgi:hypothetical protein
MSKVIANIKNQLTDKTEQYINSVSKNQPTWFSAAISVVVRNQETINSISVAINNSISAKTDSVCQGEANTSQEVKVLNCGIIAGNLRVGQNVFQTNLLSCITKQVAKITLENKVVREAIEAANNATLNGSEGFWTYIVIAIIVVVVIFIVIAIYKGFSSPTPDAPKIPPKTNRPPAKLPPPPLPPRLPPRPGVNSNTARAVAAYV